MDSPSQTYMKWPLGDITFDMFIVKDFGSKKHCKNVFTDDKSRLPLRRQVCKSTFVNDW